jgi:uncharacterized protein (DUF1786 family)
MKKTFEEYLEMVHMNENPMILDDDLPDDFDRWLSNLDVSEVMAYAEKWHDEQLQAQLIKVYDTRNN